MAPNEEVCNKITFKAYTNNSGKQCRTLIKPPTLHKTDNIRMKNHIKAETFIMKIRPVKVIEIVTSIVIIQLYFKQKLLVSIAFKSAF